MATSSARYPGRPRAAVGVLVIAWLTALAGAVLEIASRTPVTPDVLFLVVDVVVGLVYGCVAALILSRRSHPVAWLISLAAIGAGVAALGGGWTYFAVAHGRPAEGLGLTLFGSAWVPGTLALFLVVPWLVRDTPLPPAQWLGLAAGASVVAVFTVQRVAFPMSDNRATLLAVVVVGLITAASVAWRGRTGPAAERPGLGLLALGTAIMALSFLPLVLVPYTSDAVLLLVPIAHLACQAVFPAALLVTMLRNRLWGIDIALSRAVLAGLLAVGMAGVYATLVWVALWMVGSNAVAQVIAAVGVVLAVQPIRQWLEQRVRRLVWGDAASPGRAALRIGASLSSVRDPGLLLDQLAAAVGEALRLESVSLAPAEDASALGRWGTPSSPPVELAVLERRTGSGASRDDDRDADDRDDDDRDDDDAAVGVLAVTPRPGERLDRRTLDALERLQPIVAAGFGLVRAARDVERAREATTGARLAERRLIRRELHDGMGPWLSGLQLGLQGARNVLRADPEAADAVLEALQAETAQRVQDVRMLSRSLLPPVLEERGLSVAVRELAARYAESGFGVELSGLLACDPEALRDLDPRVAAAAYAVISESVLNSSRYSGTDSCRVEVRLTGAGTSTGTGSRTAAGTGGAALVVRCTDAGVGRPADAVDGVGTASMRERVHEQGGTFGVAARPDGDSAGRGTIVCATLPLDPLAVPA